MLVTSYDLGSFVCYWPFLIKFLSGSVRLLEWNVLLKDGLSVTFLMVMKMGPQLSSHCMLMDFIDSFLKLCWSNNQFNVSILIKTEQFQHKHGRWGLKVHKRKSVSLKAYRHYQVAYFPIFHSYFQLQDNLKPNMILYNRSLLDKMLYFFSYNGDVTRFEFMFPFLLIFSLTMKGCGDYPSKF